MRGVEMIDFCFWYEDGTDVGGRVAEKREEIARRRISLKWMTLCFD
jgi:hypothetical protein